MISPLKDRQGFNTLLDGVSGTSIQSAFTKPIIASGYAAENVSWLPFPYGPLPEVGPWANGNPNEKDEQPTPETHTEAQPWKAELDSGVMLSGGFILVVICLCAWVLAKKMPGGYK